MTTEHMLYEATPDGVATITFNRPAAMNALLPEMNDRLPELVAMAKLDDEVRAIVLTGAGRAFSAGADIKRMSEPGRLGRSALVGRQRTLHGAEVVEALLRREKPMIAAVNGIAFGAGSEIALLCDFIIAGTNAQFGQPEVKIGIIPGGGGTQRLIRAVGKYKAMKICLTGDVFNAREAFEMGLVSELAPDAEVEKRAVAMAQQIAGLPPLAVQQIKEVVLAGQDASLDAALRLETKASQVLFSSQDQKEGMNAFIEKRKPKFRDR
jgi:enoyl-CoA hydratase/carnithine racemase